MNKVQSKKVKNVLLFYYFIILINLINKKLRLKLKYKVREPYQVSGT